MAVSKVCWEYLSLKNRIILKAFNWFAKQSIDWFLLYHTRFNWNFISEQTIVQGFFFKDLLIFKKQSNIGNVKIFYRLTLPFRLNSSKWKALYCVECCVNCYVCFNRLLLLTSFLILALNVDYFSYMQLEIL